MRGSVRSTTYRNVLTLSSQACFVALGTLFRDVSFISSADIDDSEALVIDAVVFNRMFGVGA